MADHTSIIDDHFSKEWLLLLYLCRRLKEKESHTVAELIGSGIDWDEFETLALRHGVAAAIQENLRKFGSAPAESKDRFEGIYRSCLRSNILKISEIDRIAESLKAEGIEWISLKGAVASEIISGDIGLYPADDIDILVKPEDIDKCRNVLERMGYELMDREFDDFRDYFLKERYHISFSRENHVVEVHWNLLFRYFTADPHFWWQDSFVVESSGRNYRFLSPERDVLYNVFRAFSKGFSRLKFLLLLKEIIGYSKGSLDWVELSRYADSFGMKGVVAITLRLVRDRLDGDVPDSIVDIKGTRLRYLYGHAIKLLQRGEEAKATEKVFLAFMKDDMIDAAGVLLRRIFPSRGEIVSRYGTHNNPLQTAAQYLLNPLKMLVNRHRR